MQFDYIQLHNCGHANVLYYHTPIEKSGYFVVGALVKVQNAKKNPISQEFCHFCY